MDRRSAVAAIIALAGGAATVKSFTVDKPTEFFVIELAPELVGQCVEVDWEELKKVWEDAFKDMGVPAPALLGFAGLHLTKSTDLKLFKLAGDLPKEHGTHLPNGIALNENPPHDEGYPGREVIDQVLKMKEASHEKHEYGPWMLHVSPAWKERLTERYGMKLNKRIVGNQIVDGPDIRTSIKERIELIEGITQVVCNEMLADHYMLLEPLKALPPWVDKL